MFPQKHFHLPIPQWQTWQNDVWCANTQDLLSPHMATITHGFCLTDQWLLSMRTHLLFNFWWELNDLRPCPKNVNGNAGHAFLDASRKRKEAAPSDTWFAKEKNDKETLQNNNGFPNPSVHFKTHWSGPERPMFRGHACALQKSPQVVCGFTHPPTTVTPTPNVNDKH